MLDEDVVTCQNRLAHEKRQRITKSRRGVRVALDDELFGVICRECALGARTSESQFRHSHPLFGVRGPECIAPRSDSSQFINNDSMGK